MTLLLFVILRVYDFGFFGKCVESGNSEVFAQEH